ncbi:hypothetical protein C5L28_002443 [Lentilactobacillus parakefiri]|uniref:Uncharacterized protein n=1 Tax=Lentilactobacillus parakefiri TaxID=152332 RepID=A0A224VLC8_9LACO|nr:hypothetical protein C5L28_002443 [Lentilactobacillus parakefiri]GAW73371.1 hypothetical protein LPKJCM_02515 [Lentilactobacillus parakefiri]
MCNKQGYFLRAVPHKSYRLGGYSDHTLLYMQLNSISYLTDIMSMFTL